MPPSPPLPPPPGAAAGSGSRAGTPSRSSTDPREAQEALMDTVQLVAEGVQQLEDAQAQTAERVVGVELQMEHLSIAVQARISRLEGQQAATAQWQAEADRRHVQTNQRLASVERQLAKGQQPTPVARQPAAHTSAATQRSAAAAPPSAVGRPERMAVAAAAMRRQPGQAGRGSAAVPGAAAVLPPLPPASSTPQPRPPKQPALRIGDHSFASRDAAWALIKQLKIDLLDKPMCWDDQERGASFRFLLGLLGRHPKGAAKVPHPPVKGFISRVNGFSTGVEFHFIDACGCEHDFSALKCMEQRQEPPAVKLADAMAAAVHQQKAEFRASCERQFCWLCAAGGRTQLVVDHSCPTLPQLRAEFLEACHRRGLAVPSELAADPSTNKTIFREEDGKFAELWRQFHAQHASLRLLCKACLRAENRRRGIPRFRSHLLMLGR